MISGEDSIENLPEIIDPEENEAIENQEEEEDQEPEQTIEEKINELMQNLLNKSSAIAIKAMKDVEQMASAGQNVQQLVESANHLIETIREECSGDLNMDAPTQNQLINILLLRFEEERVNMKKAAICAVQALVLQLRDPNIVKVCAERLAIKCRDLAVAIRKQAALSMTKLLESLPEPDFGPIRSTWLHAVMHLIVDREPSVQQHAARMISEVLINPIVHNSDGFVWTLLLAIEEEADLRRLLLRTFVHLHKEKSLPHQLVKILHNKARGNQELANPCWMMLSELSAFFDVSPNDAIEHWSDRLDLGQPNRLIGYMSKLIANRADNLTLAQRNFLKTNVSDALMQHKIHPSYISAVYYMFARVVKGVGGLIAPGHKELEKFNQRCFGQSLRNLDRTVYATEPDLHASILERLESEIRAARGEDSTMLEQIDDDFDDRQTMTSVASYRTPQKNQRNGDETVYELEGTNSENSERLIRLISTIGECIQYTPALINKHLFRILQVIIASDVLQKIHLEQVERVTQTAPTPFTNQLMSPNTSFHTELQGITASVAPSQAGGSSPTHTIQTMQTGTQANYQFRIKKRVFRSELMTRNVRATGVITLGKLCLQDEQLARKCIPVFVRELKQNNDHFVRNNIIVVICDLCIRYTSMVDRYSTLLAACLRDNSLLIRRQTLMLLTNLIKEQYLKWEGPIIYRFVTALLDTNSCIQGYAHFCLHDILMPQFREHMFFHHFLECVFMFNHVYHTSWLQRNSEFSLNADMEKQCSLEGRHKSAQRMELYKYMLKTFEDKQKVAVLEKIGREIFIPIVEGGMRIGELKVRCLLFDAFEIMKSPEIKLKMQLGKLDVDYEGDDEEPPELVKTAAKKFISTTFRKSIAESVMPHLFCLNSYLLEKRSPMAKSCYSVILELCHDHEEQLDDFLASDPRLKAEIRFDLKQHRRAANNRGTRGTPCRQPPQSRPQSRAAHPPLVAAEEAVNGIGH